MFVELHQWVHKWLFRSVNNDLVSLVYNKLVHLTTYLVEMLGRELHMLEHWVVVDIVGCTALVVFVFVFVNCTEDILPEE